MEKQSPILLEVGPGQTLSSLALSILQSDRATEQVVLPSLRHSYDRQPDMAFLLNTLGQLWLAGVQINWSGFYANERRYRLPLPTYPFERQHYWISPHKQAQSVPIGQATSEKKEDAKSIESDLLLHSRSNLRNPYVAPGNEIERRIANLYQELLGIEQVGIHDNFLSWEGTR